MPDLPERRKLADVSASNAGALLTPTTWVHRRVESLSFTEQLMVRRRISVDFTIPDDYQPFIASEDGGPALYFLPVALLRKWPPLMRLDLRSEEDQPLPLLTTGKNREIDAAVLSGVAKRYLSGTDLLSEIGADLASIAKENPLAASEAATRLRDSLAGIGRSLADEAGLKFARERADPLVEFATGLVANSMLWARVEGGPGDRKIVKIAFEDPIRQEPNPRRRLFAAFSWQAIAAEYEIPHIGNSGIYHCQIDPPPQLQMVSAALVLDDPPISTDPAESLASAADDPGDEKPLALRKLAAQSLQAGALNRVREFTGAAYEDPASQREPEQGVAYSRVAKGRAHLYVSGARKSFGIASFRMAVASRTLATASLVMASVIAVLMTVFFILAPAITDHVGPALTMLVLVPGLLGFLVRPAEHPLVARHLVGVRVLTLVAAVMPILAAIVLIGVESPSASSVRPFWGAFTLGAWAVVVLLVPSWLLPVELVDEDEGR